MTQKTISSYEQSKKSPFKWIVLIILVSVFIGMVLLPQTKEWIEKREYQSTNVKLVQDLRDKDDLLTIDLGNKKRQLEDFRKEKKLEELQVFPESIDVHKIIQILELYTLQLKNLDGLYSSSFFELKNVDFKKTKNNKNDEYSETIVDLEFESDEENFKEFILFLQSGDLSQRFEEGVRNEQIDDSVYQFLTTNLLPVLHIESLTYTKMTPKKEQRDESGLSFVPEQNLSANLKVKLFSYPELDE